MTWDKVMKLRNRIRIFAVIFILALGIGVLTDGGICCRSDSGRKRYDK